MTPEIPDSPDNPHHPVRHPAPRFNVPSIIATATLLALLLGALLYHRARSGTNSVALASNAKPVTVVAAQRATYRRTHRYVGTLEPWYSARIGPQFISAYVDTVLVRPGAVVKRGDVVATLDCRNASSADQAVSMQARALERTQAALADKAARMSTLLKGGYAAPSEVEMQKAESESKQAQLLAMKAQALSASLSVKDCVLRAPFDGEVADRFVDPGAFVRPGTAIAALVDRNVVRLSADVPEADFQSVPPGTPVRIHVLSTGQHVTGTIARRAPAADASTRTIHVEIDLPNKDHAFPVGTTAELRLDAGEAVPASEIPLASASVRARKATIVVIDGDTAHKRTVEVVGESGGTLFVGPELAAGSRVVLEGREALAEGDRVAAKLASTPEAQRAERGTEPGAAPKKEL